MENQILCSNPRIILNPLAPEYISRFGFYIYCGKKYTINKRMAYFDDSVARLKPRYVKKEGSEYSTVCSVDDSVMSTSYFLDVITGEIFPMYLKVRCGHCDNCKKSKVMSLVHRCKLECMSYKFKPLFLTLTYRDDCLPENGVCLRDVQLFFKRLRINLCRNGYTDKIRYLCVSEYGKNTSRPHYHAILWNLHQSDVVSYKRIGEIIEKSWDNGFTMHRLVDVGNDKAFFYTSKYLGKDSNVPEGKNKTFMVCSNRGGSIGALFLKVLAPELQKTLNIDPKFLNHFSGKLESLQMSKFVFDRIFPSSAMQITSPIRTAVKRFVLNYAALKTYEDFDPLLRNLCNFDSSLASVYDYFSRFMYVYFPDQVGLAYLKPYNTIIREMTEDEVFIFRFMEKHGFFFDPSVLDDKRKLFLSKFFSKLSVNVDLDARARKFREMMDYGQQFELF